jgi:hypothetical protein
MLHGHVDRLDLNGVAGWAADAEDPDRTVEVVVWIDGEVYETVRCENRRADLLQLGSYGDGLHGFKVTFPMTLDPAAAHMIEVRFQDSGAVVSNGSRMVQPAAQSLTPIVLTAAGRSGTTLLMARLSAVPEICVAGSAPFEIRQLSYYAVAQRILSEGDTLENSTHPDRLDGAGSQVGHNPFFSPGYVPLLGGKARLDEFLAQVVQPKTGLLFRDIIDRYYSAAALQLDKAGAKFFAEKSNNLDPRMRAFAYSIYPDLREIMLIRDPRDMVCSHKSYFSSSKEKAFQQMSHMTRTILQMTSAPAHNRLIVKYEDLVLEPAETDRRIAGFLGVGLIGDGSRTLEEKIFQRHATAESPAQSLGRWRREIEPDDQRLYNESWREYLERFGYGLV